MESGKAATSAHKSFFTKLKHPSSFSKPQLAVFVLAFALIGYLLFKAFAAAPLVASLEAEQMSLPAGGSVLSDSTASGGTAVKLTASGTASGSVNFPSTVTSATVIAHGDQCAGAPAMTVALDGKALLSNTFVSATSWTAYSVTPSASIASGTHNLTISFNNAYSKFKGNSGKGCARNLYVDVTNFFGQTTTPPPVPTVALSASPTSVTAGQSATLTWASTNATSCTASGAWSGSEPTSGSLSTGALNQNSTYSLTCTGTGGTATASTTVTVGTPTSGSIYWGAYMNKGGNVHYYGSTDSKGVSWIDGPWSATYPTDTWDSFEAHAGKTMSLVHYGQPAPWRQAWASAPANYGWNRGAIPVVDLDTSIDMSGAHTISDQTIANGTAIINGQTFDYWWKTWFTAAKNWGHPFFFIPDVEMNGQWEPYSPFQLNNTPASYTAMWRHMHDLANSVGATNVNWVWCPNIDPNSASGIYRPLSGLYPGNSYVDWVGMDGFNMGSTATFDQLFSSTLSNINNITGSSKPFMLSQIGAVPTAQPSKAAWITDMFNQLQTTKYSQIKALVWFNWWHADGGTRDNDIETPYTGTIPIPVSNWASNSGMPGAQAFAKGVSPAYFQPKLTTMPAFGKISAP